jgi:peptide/nickel transport system ATP-binding protein
VGNPTLLIADEATSMLDVSTRAGIASTLRRLASERGLAVLFITHDLGEAMHACDRIVVLREGQVVEAGVPGRLYEAPRQTYTAELIEAGLRRLV